MKKRIQQIFDFTRDLFSRFSADNAFKHGAAIAYYTIFSLPAVIIVVVRFAGLLVGETEATDEILNQIKIYIGADTATELEGIITTLGKQKDSIWGTLISVGTLLFGATGVFYTLQDSINTIWRIPNKLDNSGGIIKVVLDRLLSFAMVVTLGFLLLVSMLLQAIISLLNNLVHALRAEITAFLNENAPAWAETLEKIDLIFWAAYLTDWLLGLIIISTVFALLFRLLPAAKLTWKDAWIGGFFTAILFSIGRTGIGWYLAQSNITSTYGAAGSLVILLLWVYYSAQIVLLGAEFIYLYTLRHGREIQPAPFIVNILDQPLETIRLWFVRKTSPKPKTSELDEPSRGDYLAELKGPEADDLEEQE
ncbi:MAG: YihY/virulence factor BrkB family protein [Bacteroidota bacterium]